MLSATPSISFTLTFNVNQFANSIPSIVIFNLNVGGGGSPGTVGGVVIGTPGSAGSAGSVGGNSGVGSVGSLSSTNTSAITPVTPSLFSSSPATGEEPIEYLFYTPQAIVHLAASSAPATAQHVMLQAIDQETPSTSGNLFGQSLSDTVSGMANPRLVPAESPPSSSLIDLVEPAEAPIEAPPAKPAEPQAPRARQDEIAPPRPVVPQVPPELMPDDQASDLPKLSLDGALALMAPAAEVGPSAQDQAMASATDSAPRFVGAAAVMVGGYTLILGQADRFRDGRFRNGRRRTRTGTC